MFKDFISALFEKNRGFTTLEIQKNLSLFKGSKAKSPNGLAHSATKFNGKSLTGFTLIELMVVLGIILILTTVVLINYRTGNQQLALARSAHKLAQDIRRAQEMAMSAKECEVCGNIVPPRYGIEFNKNSDNYFLFADINDPDGNGRYEPSDEKIETIYFEEGVIIGELLTTTPSLNPNQAWVAFKPPDPLTTIRGPGAGRLTIEITLMTGGQTREVFINQAGLIYVE